MAVITPSALISEIRGSVGDQTFSKNRYGAYVKAKLVQTVTNTAEQIAVRDELADGVEEWQNLSQADQNKWMQYANSNLLSGRISRKYKRSGYNEFLSRWQNRIALGSGSTSFEPLPKVRLFPVIKNVTVGTTQIDLEIDTLKPIGNCEIAVYATPPISPGINYIRPSYYRLIGVITPSAQVSTSNVYTAYNTKYGLTSGDIGKKIGIAIRAINTDNFAAGQFFFAQITISGGLVSSAPVRIQSVLFDYLSTQPRTVSLPNTAQENNLIVFIVRMTGTAAITLPAGFTVLATRTTNSTIAYVLYKIASNSESNSYTFSWSGTRFFYGQGFEFENIDLTTPIESIANIANASAGDLLFSASHNVPANTFYISFFTGSPGIRFILTEPEQEQLIQNDDWTGFNSWFKIFYGAENNVRFNLSFPISSSFNCGGVLFRINAP
jgi:hypothetical protein